MGQRGGSDVGDALDLCDCGLSVANNRAWVAMKRHAQNFYPARACALGLLLADGAPTVRRGKTF